jgi:hypothetical protein
MELEVCSFIFKKSEKQEKCVRIVSALVNYFAQPKNAAID